MAHAEPTDLDRARTLFEEAGELELQGDWAAAQDRLRAALRIRETPHLRYALGWALENEERLTEARTEYQTALRLARSSGAEEVSRLASARLQALDKAAPRSTRGLAVHAHDHDRDHDDRAAVSETVAPRAEQAARTPIVPWVLVGAGGALAVGSVVLLASSANDASMRDARTSQWCAATGCSDGTATRAETVEAAGLRRDAYDAASRGNAKQVGAAVLGGLGVASIAVGVYMLLKGEDREHTQTAAAAPGVQALRVSAGGVKLVF